MKGRKPKPTSIKALQGTYRKDRMNKKEPKVELKIPKRPSFLYGEGKKEWDRASKDLFDLGLLTDLDMAALAGYCSSYHHWVEVEKRIAKEGMVITVIDSQGDSVLKLVEIAT
ncbi:MAG: P27 family phage terminase small subunit [Nitrospinae bacterium]|nr:P27 family phage terminase small subunit [Nitrospinota bacterium]